MESISNHAEPTAHIARVAEQVKQQLAEWDAQSNDPRYREGAARILESQHAAMMHRRAAGGRMDVPATLKGTGKPEDEKTAKLAEILRAAPSASTQASRDENSL